MNSSLTNAHSRAAVYLVALLSLCVLPCRASDLRIGLIGTDSSHAVEFTRMLNDVTAGDHVPGARVVAAFRGGSTRLALSRDRVAAYTAELSSRWNVLLVPRIDALCSQVDGLMVLSVDPDTRDREFREAAQCGKPVFIDKPFAPALQNAQAMARFANTHHVVWFSASALRFTSLGPVRDDVRGADIWGPGALGQDYPLDLSWYGIHSIELLYAVMGPGVRSVTRTHTASADIITAVWKDGRIASVHLVRPDLNFGLVTFHSTSGATVLSPIPIDYGPLLRAVINFIRVKAPPVIPAETLEIFAFMDAAQRSLAHGGVPQTLLQTNDIHTSRP